jgi:[ribosomal protein S5]-alanine N-acetyltransferase
VLQPPSAALSGGRAQPLAISLVRVRLEKPSLDREREFLDAVRRSERFLRGWVDPPGTVGAYRAYLRRFAEPSRQAYFVVLRSGELVGVVNLSEIVRGRFQCAYLGCYGFVPYTARGYMTEGLTLVLRRAFGTLRLHRLEANIQPHNKSSLALFRRLGFRREGYSPRYLKIGVRWRDHERWALLVDEWRDRKRKDG